MTSRKELGVFLVGFILKGVIILHINIGTKCTKTFSPALQNVFIRGCPNS